MSEHSFSDLLNAAGAAAGTTDELLPGGEYDAEVIAANYKITDKGKLQIGIKYKVTSGPHAGVGTWANQTLSPESPTALDIFFRAFEALGLERSGWAQFGANLAGAGEAVAEKIKGANCRIKVAVETWQNEQRNRVERVTKAAPTAPAAVPSGLPAPRIAAFPPPPGPPF
ncbi:hypothetical protein GCM10009760_26230 [Kitasatospora kazusensis]|uniref:DUF669 domain-containing protein n=1 Tax=Kitasatospora kazusensis TaxID=407974 RepID=A0ABN2ZG92_9ACTN